MSVYPPLTQAQLTILNEAAAEIWALKTVVQDSGLPICNFPSDEDQLVVAATEMRGHVAKLDLALFRIYGLVHRLKCSNIPTTLPPTRRPPPSLDDLEGMMS